MSLNQNIVELATRIGQEIKDVRTDMALISGGGGTVDLTNYYTKTEVDDLIANIPGGAAYIPDSDGQISVSVSSMSVVETHDIFEDSSIIFTYPLATNNLDLGGVKTNTATNVTYSNKSAIFNGTASLKTFGLPADIGNYWSLNLWIKANATSPTYQEVISLPGSNKGGGQLLLTGGVFNWYGFISGAKVATTWTMITLTRDGNIFRLYEDGVLVRTVSESGVTVNFSNMSIGNDFAGEPFFGAIKQFRMFNRALTLLEIQKLYNPVKITTVTQDVGETNWLKMQFYATGFTGSLYVNDVLQTPLSVANNITTFVEKQVNTSELIIKLDGNATTISADVYIKG